MTLFRKRRPSRLPTVHIPQGWPLTRPVRSILARAVGWFLGWALFVGLAWYVDQAAAVVVPPPRPVPVKPLPAHTLPGKPVPQPAQVKPQVAPEPWPWYMLWYPRWIQPQKQECSTRDKAKKDCDK